MLPELTEVAVRRKALGLTQAELAAGAGVSRSFVAKLETGHLSPSFVMVRKLFGVLEKREGKRRGCGLGGFSVGDVHASPVETVDMGDSLRDVWISMEAASFSQFPVVDGEDIVGSITERDVNRALLEHGERAGDLKVGEVMGPPFPVVDVGVPLSSVVSLLRYSLALVTVDEDNILGIVTNSDVGRIFLDQ